MVVLGEGRFLVSGVPLYDAQEEARVSVRTVSGRARLGREQKSFM